MIYLDHAASSPLRREVWQAMGEQLGSADYNPSSTHTCGRKAHEVLDEARSRIAAAVGASRGELFFTGGGTASDNVAVLGFLRRRRAERPRLITSAIEHKAVIRAAKQAAREGVEVVFLPVDAHGQVDPGRLDDALASGGDRPTLVSIMWANNEVGTVQPIGELVETAHRHGAVFHSDAVQGFGKLDMTPAAAPVDMMTATAHKLGGPVGIGALVCRRGTCLEPLVYGGTQERGVWPGTQNPIGAVGFATAVRLCLEEREEHVPLYVAMRESLQADLVAGIPDAVVHGAGAQERLPNVLSVGVPGCDQATLLVTLDMAGVAVSSGSACSSGATTGSHVLDAMGHGGEDYSVIRVSFGPGTTEADVQTAGAALVEAIAGARTAVAS
ncbi:MAG: cysteine desulfurase family protein [Gemmatimonadota bacterium]